MDKKWRLRGDGLRGLGSRGGAESPRVALARIRRVHQVPQKK